jgi:hypothetical protein
LGKFFLPDEGFATHGLKQHEYLLFYATSGLMVWIFSSDFSSLLIFNNCEYIKDTAVTEGLKSKDERVTSV